MIEESVLTQRLSALEEYLADLDEIKKDLDWSKFNNSKLIRRYVERTLQMATEACLDIANHIISYEGYREPEDNKDAFKVLSENDIIAEDLRDKLIKMAKFRNVIVHDYLKVDSEIVYAVLTKHCNDIAIYAGVIKSKYL
jgi:uncharacterized protein YutE (UPF0331/DUF86 family)